MDRWRTHNGLSFQYYWFSSRSLVTASIFTSFPPPGSSGNWPGLHRLHRSHDTLPCQSLLVCHVLLHADQLRPGKHDWHHDRNHHSHTGRFQDPQGDPVWWAFILLTQIMQLFRPLYLIFWFCFLCFLSLLLLSCLLHYSLPVRPVVCAAFRELFCYYVWWLLCWPSTHHGGDPGEHLCGMDLWHKEVTCLCGSPTFVSKTQLLPVFKYTLVIEAAKNSCDHYGYSTWLNFKLVTFKKLVQ